MALQSSELKDPGIRKAVVAAGIRIDLAEMERITKALGSLMAQPVFKIGLATPVPVDSSSLYAGSPFGRLFASSFGKTDCVSANKPPRLS
jgi:hypothetical protein